MASAVRKDNLFGGILQFCLSYSFRFFFGSCFHSRPIEWEWVLRLDALRHSPLRRFPFRGNNPPGNLWVEALTPEFLDFMSGSSDVWSADLDLLYDFTARPAPCSRLGWIGDWCWVASVWLRDMKHIYCSLFCHFHILLTSEDSKAGLRPLDHLLVRSGILPCRNQWPAVHKWREDSGKCFSRQFLSLHW